MKFIQLFDYRLIERIKGIPYIHRWTLLGLGKDSSLFSKKIHFIVSSDEECLHNHPWPFFSIMLWGKYIEWTEYTEELRFKGWSDPVFSEKANTLVCSRVFMRGIIYRPANWKHRLELYRNEYNTGEKPCLTFILTFKKIQDWGFFTRFGFKGWREYRESEHC